jgi:uncharacterized RDD family membrane protein YckC
MYSEPLSHLPDPRYQQEFYDGVTAKRGIAWMIDVVVISIITLLVSTFTIVGLFILPLMYATISFLYRWLTIAGGSATPGMRVMAIELRDSYGQRLNGGQALLHTVGYFVTMTTVLLQLGSIGAMFATDRGQGLSDLVLGTVALNRRR